MKRLGSTNDRRPAGRKVGTWIAQERRQPRELGRAAGRRPRGRGGRGGAAADGPPGRGVMHARGREAPRAMAAAGRPPPGRAGKPASGRQEVPRDRDRPSASGLGRTQRERDRCPNGAAGRRPPQKSTEKPARAFGGGRRDNRTRRPLKTSPRPGKPGFRPCGAGGPLTRARACARTQAQALTCSQLCQVTPLAVGSPEGVSGGLPPADRRSGIAGRWASRNECQAGSCGSRHGDPSLDGCSQSVLNRGAEAPGSKVECPHSHSQQHNKIRDL